jgi:hypothetical protein
MLITIEEEKLDAILEGAYISKFGRINILRRIKNNMQAAEPSPKVPESCNYCDKRIPCQSQTAIPLRGSPECRKFLKEG